MDVNMKFDKRLTNAVVGRKITAICSVTVDEGEFWPGLELDNGTLIVIQRDAEGNGPGVAVVTDSTGNTLGYIG